MLLLDGAPDEQTKNELAARKRVWMVGHAAVFETARLMSGWKVGQGWGVGRKNAVWMVLPPGSSTGSSQGKR